MVLVTALVLNLTDTIGGGAALRLFLAVAVFLVFLPEFVVIAGLWMCIAGFIPGIQWALDVDESV